MSGDSLAGGVPAQHRSANWRWWQYVLFVAFVIPVIFVGSHLLLSLNIAVWLLAFFAFHAFGGVPYGWLDVAWANLSVVAVTLIAMATA